MLDQTWPVIDTDYKLPLVLRVSVFFMEVLHTNESLYSFVFYLFTYILKRNRCNTSIVIVHECIDKCQKWV